jgi:hypothetical protein
MRNVVVKDLLLWHTQGPVTVDVWLQPNPAAARRDVRQRRAVMSDVQQTCAVLQGATVDAVLPFADVDVRPGAAAAIPENSRLAAAMEPKQSTLTV